MKFSILITCFLSLFITSCISVGVPTSEIVSSKSLTYLDPKAPFTKAELKGVEASWKSQQSSNIITLQSNCSSENESTLESMEANAKSAFDQATTLKTSEFLYLDRKAKRSLIKGDIDGVVLMMDILVFKKDGCSYTLTFSGRNLEAETPTFQAFIDGLKLP